MAKTKRKLMRRALYVLGMSVAVVCVTTALHAQQPQYCNAHDQYMCRKAERACMNSSVCRYDPARCKIYCCSMSRWCLASLNCDTNRIVCMAR